MDILYPNMCSEVSILLNTIIEISWGGLVEREIKYLLASSSESTVHIMVYVEYYLSFFFSVIINTDRTHNTMLV